MSADSWTELPKPENELVLNVRDFGADATGARCSWKAFRDAFTACKEKHASQLDVPAGRYVFNAPEILEAKGAQFPLDALHDLTIDGHGAELIFHHIRPAFVLTHCQRLVFKNFSIDWDLPLASPGTVENDPEFGTVIRIAADFPVTKDTPVTSVTEFDFGNNVWKKDAVEIYNPDDVKLVKPQVYAASAFKNFKPGMTTVVRHWVYQAPAFTAYGAGTGNLTYDHLTIYSAPGIAFTTNGADRGFHLKGCKIMRRPGSRQLITTTADGAWFGSTLGGITVEDCDFTLMGDDSVNIHARWLKLKEIGGPRTILVDSKWGEHPEIAAGDELKFCRAKDIDERGRATVTAAQWDEKAKACRVTLAADLPADIAAGDFTGDVSRASPDFLIRNNYFHEHRARGMLIQARNGIVENNRVENVQAAALQLTTDLNFWHEGYGCENLIVRNNALKGCNYAQWERNAGGRHMACINLVADTGRLAEGIAHRNVTIENNTIEDTPGLAILVSSSDTVTIRGNTIIDANSQPFDKTGEAIDAKAGGAIMVTRASNVVIGKNTEKATRKRFAEGVYIDPRNTKNITRE